MFSNSTFFLENESLKSIAYSSDILQYKYFKFDFK